MYLGGAELCGHAFEELIDDHSGSASDHSLPEAGDRAAGTYVTGVLKDSVCVIGRELDRTIAVDESRRAFAAHAHLILGCCLKIVQADRAGENAADRADAEPHLQVVQPVARLLEFLAAGKALGYAMCIC